MSEETPAPAKKAFNWILVLIPVAIVAALVLAFSLPPSHAFIVNGPLKPVFAKIGLAGPPGARGPKAQPTADPVAEVKQLNDELAADKKAEADKDARIAALQSEVAQSQNAAASEPSPAPAAKPSPTPVPDAIKRAAAYWAEMDADKAAAVANRLPDAYVKAVFSQMPADAVAEIMNAMPPKIAAKLTAAVDAP